MARDPRIFSDVAELLADYEDELRQTLPRSGEDTRARYERVRDVRRRYEAEFEDPAEKGK